MNNKLKSLSEIVANASDLFSSKFDSVDTLMGVMDKILRKQGMAADAITIDCKSKDRKIVLLIHDAKPDVVQVALGNKEGDIYSASDYALNELSETVILRIMEKNFSTQ